MGLNVNNNLTNTLVSKTALQPGSAAFTVGEIVTAEVIAKAEDRTTLKFDNGNVLEVARSLDAEVGQRLTFEVESVDRGQVSFKRILSEMHISYNEAEEAEPMSDSEANAHILALQGKGFAFTKAILESHTEDQRRAAISLARLEKQITSAVNNCNDAAFGKLLEADLSVNKITLDILSFAVKQIPAVGKVNVSGEELAAAIEQYAGEFSDKDAADTVSKIVKFMTAQLPITSKNVRMVDAVLDKLDKIEGMTQGAIAGLLKSDMPITIDNVYMSMFASSRDQSARFPESDWEQLIPGVKDFLASLGVEADKSTMSAARFLVANDVPISIKNIEAYKQLSNSAAYMNKDTLMDGIVKQIKLRQPAGDVLLFGGGIEGLSDESKLFSVKELRSQYKATIEMLPRVNENILSSVEASGKAVTLDNLKQAVNSSGHEHQGAGQEGWGHENKSSSKRQIYEIMLRLTTEAAHRLSKHGVNIHGLPLNKALETIIQSQEQYYAEQLELTGQRATTDKVGMMWDLFDKMKGIIPRPSTLAKVLKGDVNYTLLGIYQSDKREGASSYEANMTRVDPRFGDSFSKVEGQIHDLLKSLGMEDTKENIRAASILIKNDVDVTEENALRVKEMDRKISFVTQKLHPTIAASMIGDGLNPLQMNIEEVIDYMHKYDDLLGKTSKEKISQYIYDMDRNKELSAEERKEVMAIYRMINTIERTNGWATGFVSKNNIPLTLDNLLEVSKYYERTKGKIRDVDIAIDEKFGLMEDYTNDESIRTILSKQYGDGLLNEFTDNAAPTVLRDAISKSDESITAIPLEDAVSLLSEENKVVDEPSTQPPDIKFLSELSPRVPYYLEKNEIHPGIMNMRLLHEFSKNEFSFGKDVQRFETKVPGKRSGEGLQSGALKLLRETGSPTEVLKVLDEDTESMYNSALAELEKEGSPQGILTELTELTGLKERIGATTRLIGSINGRKDSLERGDFFKIPIRVNGQVSTMNVYVLNQEASHDISSVLISLDTKNLGNVKCMANLDGNEANLVVTCERSETARYLEASKNGFIALVQETGLSLASIDFLTADYENPFNGVVLGESLTGFSGNGEKFGMSAAATEGEGTDATGGLNILL